MDSLAHWRSDAEAQGCEQYLLTGFAGNLTAQLHSCTAAQKPSSGTCACAHRQTYAQALWYGRTSTWARRCIVTTLDNQQHILANCQAT
eukprot:6172092-Pleurochrysis_carterae.AAC.2